MRRAFNLRFVSGNETRILMVPGELNFGEVYEILAEMFGLKGEEHLFTVEGSKSMIGPLDVLSVDEPEEHRYLSGNIGKAFKCLDFSGTAIDATWLEDTESEEDSPRVTGWTGSADRTDEVNQWLDDNYFLLAEADGNPDGKQYVYTDELNEDVAEAFLSPEAFTFYIDLSEPMLLTLEENDMYGRTTVDETEENGDCLFIRSARNIPVFCMATEYSGRSIADKESYLAFESEHIADSGWILFRKRALRELLRKWVKDNALWIDLSDLDVIFDSIRLF